MSPNQQQQQQQQQQQHPNNNYDIVLELFINDTLTLVFTTNLTSIATTLVGGSEIIPSITIFYYKNILLTLIMLIMTFMTVCGNLLVIIAFVSDASIRTYSNYFILNLSITDLLVGIICIPLYAPKFISGQWYFGYHLCKLWLVFDYVVGSASTLCIVVISFDRYQMVSRGLKYISERSVRRALIFVFGTWIVASLNYGPAIIFWDLFSSTKFNHHECDAPFAHSFPYLVTTAFVEFFVPFFSLTTLNLMVYLNIRQRSRGLIRTSTTLGLSKKHQKDNKNNDLNHIQISNGHMNKTNHILLQPTTTATTIHLLPSRTTYSKSSSTSANLARDKKAARSLFILVFAFVICWCPYTLLTLIRALCKQPTKCISNTLYEFTFWLLWLNSTINPLLYSFLHVKFRKAFYRILCPYSIRSSRSVRNK
ncbi:unnamed protein product [Didymodactylos carnosus]|uniref:G-protein coupled receptors family 1 profile domain-containing protein n=1 Tax=Didymodactylos carnosus TaxID=1234261 RepID=A0A814ABE0_9BILA|nr:unnamed protein product [Didymodactylos carnosus]CAF3691529.1 unnamed protein product [Didymodactylos carnosus]